MTDSLEMKRILLTSCLNDLTPAQALSVVTQWLYDTPSIEYAGRSGVECWWVPTEDPDTTLTITITTEDSE